MLSFRFVTVFVVSVVFLLSAANADEVGVCKFQLADTSFYYNFTLSSLNQTILSYPTTQGQWYVRLCGPWPQKYTDMGCSQVSAICLVNQATAVSFGASKPSVALTKIWNGVQFGFTGGDYCTASSSNRVATLSATCASSPAKVTALSLDSMSCHAYLTVSAPQACSVQTPIPSPMAAQVGEASNNTLEIALWASIASSIVIVVTACVVACCIYSCAQRKRTRCAYSRLQDVSCQTTPVQVPYQQTYIPVPQAPSVQHPQMIAPHPPMGQPMGQHPNYQPGMVYLIPYMPPQQPAQKQ